MERPSRKTATALSFLFDSLNYPSIQRSSNNGCPGSPAGGGSGWYSSTCTSSSCPMCTLEERLKTTSAEGCSAQYIATGSLNIEPRTLIELGSLMPMYVKRTATSPVFTKTAAFSDSGSCATNTDPSPRCENGIVGKPNNTLWYSFSLDPFVWYGVCVFCKEDCLARFCFQTLFELRKLLSRPKTRMI